MTPEEEEARIIAHCAHNPRRCLQALSWVYEEQTQDEKASRTSIDRNNRGFSISHCSDGEKYATMYKEGKTFSNIEDYDRPMHLVTTYSRQILLHLASLPKGEHASFWEPEKKSESDEDEDDPIFIRRTRKRTEKHTDSFVVYDTSQSVVAVHSFVDDLLLFLISKCSSPLEVIKLMRPVLTHENYIHTQIWKTKRYQQICKHDTIYTLWNGTWIEAFVSSIDDLSIRVTFTDGACGVFTGPDRDFAYRF